MGRPLLLGLDNPHSKDPRAALLPRPVGSAGYRLLAMSGLGWRKYRETFERANVCDVPKSASFERLGNRTVIVLGREAWKELGMSEALPHFSEVWCAELCSTLIYVPHPSGRNPYYNSEANRDRLRRLLTRAHRNYIKESRI